MRPGVKGASRVWPAFLAASPVRGSVLRGHVLQRPGMTAKTIDEYLAGVAPEQRKALERLRKQIKAAAPKAEECRLDAPLPAALVKRLVGARLAECGN